jgi:hypothetical protein
MLAGQYFGGGHHHPLAAGFDRDQQGHQRHKRFSRADITLQEAVHAGWRSHICRNFGDGAILRPGWQIVQCRQYLCAQMPIAPALAARLAPRPRPRQRKGKLVGQQFIIGQPRPCRAVCAQIQNGGGLMRRQYRVLPIWPAHLRLQRQIDPFCQQQARAPALRRWPLPPAFCIYPRAKRIDRLCLR